MTAAPVPPAPAAPTARPEPAPPRRSLVVPCYQEQDALAPFGALLPGLPVDEVLFVDDGSRDGTAAALARLAAADGRVRVLTHARNRGVGAAMRTGLEAARGAVVAVYDADRTYPVQDLERLFDAVERGGAEVASADPQAVAGGLAGVPAWRRALTRGAAGAYRLVLGPRAQRVSTFTCAFRAYARSVLPRALPRADGFAAAAEMLGRALLAGARVVELPSPLRTRTEGVSKLRVLRALRGHLLTLVRLARLRARPSRAAAD